MTIETLQQGNDLQSQIVNVRTQLNQVTTMLDTTTDPTVKSRVRGMDFELPKAVFKGELMKKKTELEAQLTSLETEFNRL